MEKCSRCTTDRKGWTGQCRKCGGEYGVSYPQPVQAQPQPLVSRTSFFISPK